MIDRLVLANAALLLATTLVALACLEPDAHSARASDTTPTPVAQRQPAPAATTALGPEVSIRLDDVDLAAPDGPRALLLRIRHAARTLCEAARRGDARAQAECVRETTDRAVAELCDPAVAALNAAGVRSRD